jgi:hypothetical protein
MHDLRQLLDEEATRVRGDTRALDAIVRRAGRRRRNRRMGTAAVALIVATAGMIGVFSAFGRPGPQVAPGADGFRGIWPQPTRAEAEEAQACADAGDPGCTWQTDADAVVKRYATEELAWTDLFYVLQGIGEGPEDIEEGSTQVIDRDLDLGLLDEPGPLFVSVSECHRDGPCHGANIVLERLLRPEPAGVWSVTSAETFEHIFAEATPSPAPAPAETPPSVAALPHSVDELVDAFMSARLHGRDAEGFLVSFALRQYEQREGGLSLYGYTTDPGTSWEISGWWEDQRRDDTFLVVIRVHDQGTTGTKHETLQIGSHTEGNAKSYSVLYAERNE